MSCVLGWSPMATSKIQRAAKELSWAPQPLHHVPLQQSAQRRRPLLPFRPRQQNLHFCWDVRCQIHSRAPVRPVLLEQEPQNQHQHMLSRRRQHMEHRRISMGPPRHPPQPLPLAVLTRRKLERRRERERDSTKTMMYIHHHHPPPPPLHCLRLRLRLRPPPVRFHP